MQPGQIREGSYSVTVAQNADHGLGNRTEGFPVGDSNVAGVPGIRNGADIECGAPPARDIAKRPAQLRQVVGCRQHHRAETRVARHSRPLSLSTLWLWIVGRFLSVDTRVSGNQRR